MASSGLHCQTDVAVRNRHTPVPIQQAENSPQQLSALSADLLVVITVRRCWPIACLWQQSQLVKLAKVFCYSRLESSGPLIQSGDGLPTSAFLILVPRTKVVPHILAAVSEFVHDCQKLWALISECAGAAGPVCSSG